MFFYIERFIDNLFLCTFVNYADHNAYIQAYWKAIFTAFVGILSTRQ